MKSLLTYILESAMSRKNYIAAIDGVSQKVFQHILAVHMYPMVREQNHWKKEIKALLAPLFGQLKAGDSVKQRYKIVWDYLIEQPYDSFEHHEDMVQWVSSVASDKDEYHISVPPDVLWAAIRPNIIQLYQLIITTVANNKIGDLTQILKTYQPNKL